MTSANAFSPPSTFGFVWPIWGALPVENHELRETCDRGAVYVAELVALPFSFFPPVHDWIASAIESLVHALSIYFCGATPGEDPADARPPPVETDVAYPQVTLADACANLCVIPDGHPNAGHVYRFESPSDYGMTGNPCAPCESDRDGEACQTARERTCDEAERYRDATQLFTCRVEVAPGEECPSSQQEFNGACADRTSDEDLCRTNVRNAASQCHGGSGFENYNYLLESRYVVYYRDESSGACEIKAEAVSREDTAEALRHAEEHSGDAAPDLCDDSWGYVNGTTGSGDSLPDHPWFAACKYSERMPGDVPVGVTCASLPTEADALSAMRSGHPPANAEPVRIVYEISGCSRSEETEIPIELGDPNTNTSCDSGRFKCPKQVCRYRNRSPFAMPPHCPADGADLFLGDNDFQLRSFAFAGGELPNKEDGVRLASWRDDPRNLSEIQFTETTRNLGRVSVAQAEFYWDQDEDWHDNDFEHSLGRGRIEWMWDMAWKARLRRISFGNATDTRSIAGECGDACSGGGLSEILGTLFSH